MTEENNKSRCRWCNLANHLYVRYHDEEWAFRATMTTLCMSC